MVGNDATIREGFLAGVMTADAVTETSGFRRFRQRAARAVSDFALRMQPGRALDQRTSELAASERRFRLLVEAVVEYAIFMIRLDGTVASWNSGAERIKGYRAEEIVGRHYRTFYPPEYAAAGEPERALAAALRDGHFEAEGWRVRKDGSRFWAGITLARVDDEQGEPIGFAKITRDLTERHDTQKALERAREQLFESQKLEAIGRLTGGIAHDFNNLLAVMLSGLALIERMAGANDRLGYVMDEMRRTIQRGESVTKQLLSFSRRQDIRPENVDTAERLDEMSRFADRILSDNITVVREVAEDLPPVLIDAQQFDLALLNVCLNARDAMPDGGVLTISARKESRPDPAAGTPSSFVSVSIADTGTGIAPDTLPRVFEPFFTTKEVGKGTGLGLSQAYGFATQSGGAIDIDSTPSVGTTVTFHLPVGSGPPVSAQPATGARLTTSARLAASDSPGATVLIVEDNRRLAHFTAQLFESAGYRVVAAETADAALAQLRANGKIDAIFSDIVMPGTMSGVQFARVVRSDFPGVPILLSTGYSDAAGEAEREGARIVPKPYDPNRVIALIGELIAESSQPS